jgi:hypothetical protein
VRRYFWCSENAANQFVPKSLPVTSGELTGTRAHR